MMLPNFPILARLESIRETKPGQWIARCPAHADSTESLSISVGDNGGLLLHCHAKCEKVEILRSINATFGDLFPATHGRSASGQGNEKTSGPAPKLVAAYDYRDASGALLYQSCRYEPGPNGRKKTFKQRAPKPDGKGWSYSVRDIPAVLYRLPELLASNPGTPVFVAEGERKVETLRSAGFVATCKVGGAGGWQQSYSETLRGRHIIILPDNDDPGRKHAAEVAAALHGIATSIRILELPGLPPKGDIVDWVKIAGNSPAKLRELADACPEWEPTTGSEPASISSGRVEITITQDEISVNDAAVAALARDESLYQRGGELVRIVDVAIGGKQRDGLFRPEGGPRISPVPLASLRERMTKAIYFQRKGGEGECVQTSPPDWCVKAVHARGQWNGIRPLKAIATSPILRDDGTILSEPGYDAKTGIYLAWSDSAFCVPDFPTMEQVRAAVAKLTDVVVDFPFRTKEHRSTWLSAVLTPIARHAFRGPAPLHLADANVRGSGKTLLMTLPAIIATGREAARMVNDANDAEMRKRITSMVLAGDSLVLLDNLADGLGCASLDAALTGTTWKDRELGGNRIIEAELSMTWYASGNNVSLLADTARRVVHCRLESPEECPEEREGFRHANLLQFVTDNRRELLEAALTILRGYFVAGLPKQPLKPWGSFEGWSDLVRQSIVWAGEPDPGLTREELREQSDTEGSTLRALIDGIQAADPKGVGMTAAEMIRCSKHRMDDSGDEFELAEAKLRDSILNLCGCRDGSLPSPKSLGKKLAHFRGRVVDGKSLTGKPNRDGTVVWSVQCGVCSVSQGFSLLALAPEKIDSSENACREIQAPRVGLAETPQKHPNPARERTGQGSSEIRHNPMSPFCDCEDWFHFGGSGDRWCSSCFDREAAAS